MFFIKYYCETLPMQCIIKHSAVYTSQSWVLGDDKACRQGLVWKNGSPVLTFAFSAYSPTQRGSWGMVQLFKVIVLISIVLVVALVGIMHQVSWSPGKPFLHSHLQIGKKKQVLVNILVFYCWFSGPPWTRWFYSILHSLVRKIGSFWDFSRKNFQRYSLNGLKNIVTSNQA